MENTLENKAKFFALYWGQKVFKIQSENCPANQQVNPQFIGKFLDEKSVLELKPLSSITDEDAIESCKLAYNLSFTYGADWKTELDNDLGFITIKSKGSHHSFDLDFETGQVQQYQDEYNESGNLMNHGSVFDYLRSKGYALPYMGLSVEALIEYGWIKLAE